MTLALALWLLAPSARALQIDSFVTPQTVSNPPLGDFATDVVTNPAGAVASTRSLQTYGSGADLPVTASIGGGLFEVAQSAAVSGSPRSDGIITWDLPTPLDLTAGGTADAFVFDVADPTLPADLAIILRSPCSPSCTGTAGSVLFVQLGAARSYRLPFSDFGQLFSEPVDFAAVTQIYFEVDILQDMPAGSIRIGPLSTVPEPAALLPWLAALALLRRRRMPGTEGDSCPIPLR
ncbi:MAG TPA: hypothetical protein VMR86_08055 [Myxococcota bacterium]|nr:hypothetical protein [Myxococcota bacterium]